MNFNGKMPSVLFQRQDAVGTLCILRMTMKQKVDLTQGKIAYQLTKLALPIMMTMFVQMAYVLIDMFWIGRLGSGAVAAIGSAGFFTWLGMSVAFLPKTGIEVTVAQSAGKNDYSALLVYLKNGLLLTMIVAVIYSVTIFSFAPSLIGFFNLGSDINGYDPNTNAISYIRILCCGMVLTYLNLSFTAIYNGLGKSKMPFYLNSIGLIINIILDPLIIYGVGPFPRLEVSGAAMATIFAHFVVFCLFVIRLRKDFGSLKETAAKEEPHCPKAAMRRIVKIGLPPAVQGAMFASIAIVIARIISNWGPIAIAVQRIGSQIEALSWMTASGFSIAISSFVGQNYGAGQVKRVWQGFITAKCIITVVGISTTLLFLLIPEQLFKIFVSEPDTIHQGVVYMTIISYSQLFMCLEMTTAGAFNGLGKSIPPSIISISFNLLRIPAALYLSGIIGLSGIWWSISGSSMFKGVILLTWFIFYFKIKYKELL